VSIRRGQVWFRTTRVGTLRAGGSGRLLFAYDAKWLDDGFPISISIPLENGDREVDAHDYFEGLLPEGRTRQRLRRQLKLATGDDAGLLFTIGRDCAGALTILPEGEHPDAHRAARHRLTDEEFGSLIESRGATVPSVGGRQRFSLAGAQDKLAVISEDDREDGKLWLPNANTPSSHILKFETLPWVCFSEYMGNRLAERVGLGVCKTEYLRASTEPPIPYLRLTRYDRRGTGSARRRLHQEDIAQALGYPSDAKYEQDGGPSLGEVSELLRGHVENPIEDITRLRDWQLFNYLIGNSDAHAKNLALLYDPETGVPSLAPFYDLVCIEFHNRIGAANFDRTMAFFVGKRSLPEEIRRTDWEALAKAIRVSPRGLLRRLQELAEVLPGYARDIREAFAAEFGDNLVYDRCVETVADRCRWTTNNIFR